MQKPSKRMPGRLLHFTGAGKGIRTLDPRLGKPLFAIVLQKFKGLHHEEKVLYLLYFITLHAKYHDLISYRSEQRNTSRCTTLHHGIFNALSCSNYPGINRCIQPTLYESDDTKFLRKSTSYCTTRVCVYHY